MGKQVRNALGFALWASGKRKLCMVPCPFVIFMGFGIWRNKEMRDSSKSLFGVAMQDTSRGGDNFNGKVGFPSSNYAALKLYCKL